jgi:hypothetical protein
MTEKVKIPVITDTVMVDGIIKKRGALGKTGVKTKKNGSVTSVE